WEAERDLAKQEKRRPGWTKPKLGKLESAKSKPKMPSCDEGEGDNDEEEEEQQSEDDEPHAEAD
ncbi:hypothetical protein C8Q76DRAFT_625554, partial [Earliella scabrosa]